jgi:hypothetical protein
VAKKSSRKEEKIRFGSKNPKCVMLLPWKNSLIAHHPAACNKDFAKL